MIQKFENINMFSLFSDIVGPGAAFCEDSMVDVTLVSHDNKQIKAHKIVISSASRVLREILEADLEKHSSPVLAEVDSEMLSSLFDCIYSGRARTQQRNMEHL